MRTDDRGVSEILGYALVFSLIISTVGIVSVAGMTELQDTRDTEQLNNAQRAFDLLATNMNDIARRGAPSRSTEIRLAEAQLDIGSKVDFTLKAVHSSTVNVTRQIDVRPIVYRSSDSDSKVVYSAGAVFRGDGDSAAAVRKPDMVVRNESVIIPFIKTRGGVQGLSGSTVRVRVDRPFNRKTWADVAVSNSTGFYDRVYMNVSSPRADSWEDMLSDYEAFNCTSPSATSVSCRAKPDEVHISVIPVDVSIED